MNPTRFLAFCLSLTLLAGALCGCTPRGGSSSGSSASGNPVSEPPISSEPDKVPSTIEGLGSSAAEPAMSSDFGQLTTLDATKKGWGPGTQTDDQNRPIGATAYQEKYGKYNADFIAPPSQKIYLTFDEGYENGYTEKILDILKDKQVSAVFFVTYDYVNRNPELVRRMIHEGHTVGNHSWSHPSFPELSLDKAQSEIQKLHDYVKENFGYTMTLFRYPMGEFNEQTLALVQQLGYRSVFWSFAYKDWDPNAQPDTASSLQKIVSSAHGGGIYLLHAVSATNTAILGEVIDQLREKGYTFSAYDL